MYMDVIEILLKDEKELVWFVWFGLLVLWHINLCWLFNAKSIFM